ncbi:MAG TPA: hypothetical protein VGQ17_03105 [Gemmatimonadales bacterium]|nr:hypothetical protein [Gemmatimonadales bacterium]
MTVNGRRSTVNGGARAGLLLLAGLGVMAARVAAQDSVQVIRPEARAPDTTAGARLPADVLAEVLGAWNDSLTTRVVGNLLFPEGTRFTGPLAVFRGNLRVSGELVGRVTVINGDLVVDPGGSVTGSVLVVGGRIQVRPGGILAGRRRSFPQPALLYRTGAGLLAVREPARRLGDLASARARLTAGRFRTTLSVETGRTYNRVEGLPIVFGPSVVREGLPNVEGRLDLRGIGWTAPDRTDRRASFGYSGRLEFRFGESRRLAVGTHAYRLIASSEEVPLSRSETGWSALLFQRDYRDYYQATGVSGWSTYELGGGLTLGASLRRDEERSVPANDPVSVFRNEAWRPNALVDDGHYLSWRVGLDLDTRNDAESPTSGWLVHGWWERSQSDDAAPLTLPPEVRDPIPAGRYRSSRVWLDARRYARFNPTVRAALRLVAGGWVAGDPLPVQRRLSLGGPDLLPGYGFRRTNCAPAGLADPAHPALCDRLIATQLEVRTRTRMGLPVPTADPYLTALQRIFAIREPDVVIFGDAGAAWVAGEGPGRIPRDRLPVLREWKADIGFGIDAGGIGFYIAQPFTDGLPLTFTVRLQRRF